MHPKSADRVVHYVLAKYAVEIPDRPLLLSDDGQYTYLEVDLLSNRFANSLSDLGITKGDRVLCMLPNGPTYVILWLALCKLGAMMVPINDAYIGRWLLNQMNDAEAEVAIMDAVYLDRLIEIRPQLKYLKRLIALGEQPSSEVAQRLQVEVLDFQVLYEGKEDPLPPVVEYWDPMAIFYTSGTTGPSKGVIYTHAQAHATAMPMAQHCDANDIFYMFLPMFHVALPHCFGTVFYAGGAMAIRERFSISKFWEDIDRFGCTITMLLGATANFVYRQPPRDDDARHPLRKVLMTPLIPEVEDFKRRFNCQVMTWFNMTEVSTPIHSDGFNLVDNRSCGRVRPGIQARIVDEHDEPVPPGTVGELVLRADDPWVFNAGYWKQPEATAAAWRNQWLHTGDAFYQNENGDFYFVDRLKDAIRRRGENISSFEVEEAVNSYPAVLESAAVAVPAEDGEDEVKIVVVPKPDHTIDPTALIEYLAERMPYFMVPRYVEIQSELPKTPTGKIQKEPLRASGISNAWDREAAGIKIRRR